MTSKYQVDYLVLSGGNGVTHYVYDSVAAANVVRAIDALERAEQRAAITIAEIIRNDNGLG